VIEVVDCGSGISEEHLPKIFEPYWQAAQQRRQGLGLGLAIAKGIIEAHCNRIWVESQAGGWQSLWFDPDSGRYSGSLRTPPANHAVR